MKKAELLQTALKIMKRQINNGGIELPSGEAVVIGLDEARALVEALEGLTWVNFYKYRNDTHVIGVEHQTYSECLPRPEISVAGGYYETVGIIRLKDLQDEK